MSDNSRKNENGIPAFEDNETINEKLNENNENSEENRAESIEDELLEVSEEDLTELEPDLSVRDETGRKMEKGKKEKSRYSSFFAKVVCVFAAVLVWFYASGEQSEKYEKVFYGVPVDFSGSQSIERQGYTVISGSGASVDVTVSGKRREVNGLRMADVTAYADLSDIMSSGEHTLRINSNVNGNSSAVKIVPETVVVYVDTAAQKELPVVPELLSGGTNDMSVKISELVPESNLVRVTGPAAELEKITRAAVGVSLDGLIGSSVEYKGKITLENADGEKYSNAYVKTDKTEMNVRVVVTKSKTVPILPAFDDDTFGEKCEAGLSLGTAMISGNVDVIDKISEIKTETIDTSEIAGDVSFSKKLIIPPGVTLEGGATAVTVSLKMRENVSAELNVSNIFPMNVPEDMTVEVNEKPVRMTFAGSPAAVSALDAKGIYATADASACRNEGEYDLPLAVHCEDDRVSVSGEYFCHVKAVKKTAD